MTWGRILLGLGLAGALVWAAVALVQAVGHHEAVQRQAGAQAQSSADMTETIKRTEQGNAAREDVRNPGSTARYDQCLRSARNTEVCKRFLPE